MAIKPFTSDQLVLIEKGKRKTNDFEKLVLKALCLDNQVHIAMKNYYIAGGSGIGKSFCINETARKHDIELVTITSEYSMSAFVILMATKEYSRKEGEIIYVHIDDADSLFSDNDYLSVMKGMLDEDRNKLVWSKNLTSQIQTHEKIDTENSRLIVAALNKYQTVGGVGVEIPTDNMVFIITSNQVLAPSNPPPKNKRTRHEAAIRSRIDYTEVIQTSDEAWGWIAYLTLHNNSLKINKGQKHILLDWMHVNWDRIPTPDMRFIKWLTANMLNNPTDYPDIWEDKLKKKI